MFDDLTHDEWRRMLNVHLDGGFHLSQPAYRAMKAAGGGRFVFVSSSAGMFGQPMEAHYAAAKSGLIGLMNVIAIEGEAHGILANAVLPTGFSRMVTETVGDEKFLAESGFMRAIRAEARGAPGCLSWQVGPCVHPSQHIPRAPAATPGCSSALGGGWLAEADSTPGAEDIAAHIRRHLGHRAVHRARLDCRRGVGSLRPSRNQPDARRCRDRLPRTRATRRVRSDRATADIPAKIRPVGRI